MNLKVARNASQLRDTVIKHDRTSIKRIEYGIGPAFEVHMPRWVTVECGSGYRYNPQLKYPIQSNDLRFGCKLDA